jgi:histidinol-phosphate aminotransferase
MKLPLSPFLKTLPTYQPGRPIEEVARELACPPTPSSRSRRTKIRSARRRSRWPRCKRPWRIGVNLYPDGNAFYLKQKLAAKLGVETRI